MATKKKLPSARSQSDGGMKKMNKEGKEEIKKQLGENKAVLHMENDGKTSKGYVGGDPSALFEIFRSLSKDPLTLELMSKASAIAALDRISSAIGDCSECSEKKPSKKQPAKKKSTK